MGKRAPLKTGELNLQKNVFCKYDYILIYGCCERREMRDTMNPIAELWGEFVLWFYGYTTLTLPTISPAAIVVLIGAAVVSVIGVLWVLRPAPVQQHIHPPSNDAGAGCVVGLVLVVVVLVALVVLFLGSVALFT